MVAIPDEPAGGLTHLDESGAARMVDVSEKPITRREAIASACVIMQPSTLERIISGKAAKGDVLATARVAGIMAAKRTGELIPLCHPLPLESVKVDIQAEPPDRLRIVARAVVVARTGVEMEAIAAAGVAAMTIYDMCKAVDRSMEITDLRLEEKTGGRSGHYRRGAREEGEPAKGGQEAAPRSLATVVDESPAPANRLPSEQDTGTRAASASEGAPYCRLTGEPLQLQEVIDAVIGPGSSGQGAVVTFAGVVRDHNLGKAVVRLHYEAYAPMVISTLASIIARIQGSIPGTKVAIVHREGTLEVGDTAVVIAASAPHRNEAFDACRQAIELLKQDVPIWKKELSPTGEEWLGMRP